MAKLCRGLPIGSRCRVACNSGIKQCQIISVYNLRGVKKRRPSATVGNLVAVTAKTAPKALKKKIYKAVVVRQVKPIRRAVSRISFADNAVVILNSDLTVKGSRLRGVVAKEAQCRVPSLTGKGAIIY